MPFGSTFSLTPPSPAPSLNERPLGGVYRRVDDENNRRDKRLQKVGMLVRPVDRAARCNHVDVEGCQGCDGEHLQTSSKLEHSSKSKDDGDSAQLKRLWRGVFLSFPFLF